jgi:D-ala D-ala ligase C-terminus
LRQTEDVAETHDHATPPISRRRAADGAQVLEANAIPGLTDTSLLPMAAEAAGLEFKRLCGPLLELALERGAAPAAAR